MTPELAMLLGGLAGCLLVNGLYYLAVVLLERRDERRWRKARRS